MALEYLNRRGDRYYVLQGKTKTGKTKYYCGKKPGENTVEQLPVEFELHEEPMRGLVSVRKRRPTRIHSAERHLVERHCVELCGDHLVVEVENDSLVVYAPQRNGREIERFVSELGILPGKVEEARKILLRQSNYDALLRFSLADENNRLYSAERWCFRGSIDGWIPLFSYQELPLDTLALALLPTIGGEDFFELM